MTQKTHLRNQHWSGRRDSNPSAEAESLVAGGDQHQLFPAQGQQLGLALKEKALDAFEGRPWLWRAREVANWLLRLHPECPISIDDVRYFVGPPPSANMAGAVFRRKFMPVGRVVSDKPEGHGNLIRQWVLRSTA